MATRYEQIIANVRSMVSQNAPAQDIDGYLAIEGLSPKQFKRLVEGPTIGGQTKEFFKGLIPGAVGLGEAAVTGASALLPEEMEQSVRGYVGKKAEGVRKAFAPELGYEDTVSRKLGEAVGSTIPFFALGPLGVAGRVASAGIGTAAGAGEARERAEEAGVKGDDRALATALGIGPGLLDTVAPQIKFAKNIVYTAFLRGGVEGATEAAQKVSQNLIAKGIYKPDQPILADAAEEGAYGAGAGALTSFLLDATLGRRARTTTTTAPPTTTPAGLPTTATQGELFDDGMSGFGKLPPEPYRAAEETEGQRRANLLAITQMREQHDVLMREVDRLKSQYEAPATTPEQKQAILEQADRLNDARADLEKQIKSISKQTEGAERTEDAAGQMGLDFGMPEMPRQKTGEGVALGEEEETTGALSPDQVEMFRQERVNDIQNRISTGEMVTPAEMQFLQMDARDQANALAAQPTPEIFTGEPQAGGQQELLLPDQTQPSGFFQLQPSNIPQPQLEAPAVAIEEETRPVTEADFQAMGIGRTNKKLREALLDKDLADPVQRAEVREVLTDFANNPNRSTKMVEGIQKFLESPTFMEQGELDLRKPRKPRAKKEATNVTGSIEPNAGATEQSTPMVGERQEAPATGIEETVGGRLDVAPAPTEQIDVGEGAQPTALAEEIPPPEGKITAKDAIAELMANGYKRSEATTYVNSAADINDHVDTADIANFLGKTSIAPVAPVAPVTPVTPKAPKAPKKEKYTPEQRAKAELVAKEFGGTVAWQEGDLALIRAFSVISGKPVHIVAKGAWHSYVQVSSYTGNVITPQEKTKLTKIVDQLEAKDATKHKSKPFPTFTQGQVSASGSTPKELVGIAKGWLKLLGIKANVYITTVEDARADKDKFTGPYRAIGSVGLDPNELGSMRRLPTGEYYISFTKSTSKTAMLETLAHEIGHIHEREVYQNASPAVKATITTEFNAWLVDRHGETGRQLVDALRAKTTAKRTGVVEGRMAADLKDYWRSFDEWYADQVSRWATTSEKPIGVVEQFFARLARALRTFFGNLKNNRYLPNETFKEYLEAVHEGAQPISDVQQDTGEAKPMLKEVLDTVSANFKKWFGNSVIRNANGTPKIMYHGTAQDIHSFKPKQAGAIFVTDDPRFADSYTSSSEDYMVKEAINTLSPEEKITLQTKANKIAKREGTSAEDEFRALVKESLPSRANIIPVYVSAQNPFDFDNPEHVKTLQATGTLDASDIAFIKQGNWKQIESFRTQSAIKAAGFDGFYMREGGRKNLAVYDPGQIKSIFNTGSYDRNDSRISYQLKNTEENLTPEGKKAAALNERMKGISNPREDGAEVIGKGLAGVHHFFTRKEGPGLYTRFRRAFVDSDATVNEKVQAEFDNALINAMGDVRADLLVDQAQDATGLAESYMELGNIEINKYGLAQTSKKEGAPTMKGVFDKLHKLGDKLGSVSLAVQVAHNALIANRANEINAHNAEVQKEVDAALAKKNIKAATALEKKKITIRASAEEIAAGLEAMEAYPEIKSILKEFTAYKNGLVDFLQQTGRINAETAKNWKENAGYVPWTRIEEEVNTFDDAPAMYKTGLINLSQLPKLDREGSSKEIANVFDNMIGLTNWAIKTGLKTRAASALATQLPDAKEIKTDDELKRELKNNKNRVIFAYKDGERTAYLLGSPLDMSAFSNNVEVLGPIVSSFKYMGDMLRGAITHMPAFALSQLVQDGTYRGMLLSGVNNPFSIPPKVFKNFGRALRGELTDLQSLGITGVYDGMPDQVSRRARERYGIAERGKIKKVWDRLEQFSTAADLAVRAAIYEQTIAETKSAAMPDGDQRLALYRAKEYINFKRAGANPTVRTMRHMIPFMNAYIQGMDVLTRTMQGKGVSLAEKRQAQMLFFGTGLKLAALNMLYTLLVGDDDDYKGLEEYERDKNYIIPGTGLKVPVAPELGFMFKVIPERIINYVVSQGTERPQDASDFFRGFRDAFITAYSTPNAMPQAVKPALEVMVNYSFFTGNPIVGQAMRNVDPSLQFTSGTSEIAKLFGMVGVSPMKVDHLIRGYTGMIGAIALDVTDAVADPNRASKPINKIPQISTFMYDPSGRGYKSEFYRFRESVDKVVDTVNLFKREGRVEELHEYLNEDNLKLYAMRGVATKVEQQLSNLRKYRNIISADPELSGSEKQEKIKEIQEQEKALLLAYNIPKLREMSGL